MEDRTENRGVGTGNGLGSKGTQFRRGNRAAARENAAPVPHLERFNGESTLMYALRYCSAYPRRHPDEHEMFIHARRMFKQDPNKAAALLDKLIGDYRAEHPVEAVVETDEGSERAVAHARRILTEIGLDVEEFLKMRAARTKEREGRS